MTQMTSHWMRAAALAVLASTAGAQERPVTPEDNAAALKAIEAAVAKIDKELSSRGIVLTPDSDAAQLACAQSGDAERALREATGASPETLLGLAQRFSELSNQCKTRSEGAVGRSLQVQELQALRIEALVRHKACGADPLKSGVVLLDCSQVAPALEATLAVLVTPQAKLGRAAFDDLQALGGKAQATVGGLLARLGTADKRAGSAKAAAVAMATMSRSTAPPRLGLSADLRAKAAQTLPDKMRKEVRAAQAESERLLDALLAWTRCAVNNDTCEAGALAKARVASAALEKGAKSVEVDDTALSNASIGMEILTGAPDTREARLQRAIAFRQFLDDNPDVKSFFGGDAAGLSAGAKDSTVTLRIVADSLGSLIGRSNRWSFTLSAPTNKDTGRATFVNSVDAFNNVSSIGVGWQLTNAPFEFPGTGTMNDFAVSLRVGQETRNYLLAGAADPLTAKPEEQTVRPLKVGARWAFLANPAGKWKTLMLFSLDRQRSFKDADTTTRCPVNAAPADATLVPCFTGAWGAPTRSFSRLLGFELRQAMPAFDIGLRLKQDLKTNKLDTEIPVYLLRGIRNADPEGKTSFSAGITAARSTGDKAPKWGVFVAAPLSFANPGF